MIYLDNDEVVFDETKGQIALQPEGTHKIDVIIGEKR